MKLGESVIQKIKQLGYDEAEKYFGRGKATLKSWENQSDKVPAWAAEKVIEENKPTPLEGNGITIPETPQCHTDSAERFANIELRLARLEAKTDTTSMHPQVTPPKPQPNWTAPHPESIRR